MASSPALRGQRVKVVHHSLCHAPQAHSSLMRAKWMATRTRHSTSACSALSTPSLPPHPLTRAYHARPHLGHTAPLGPHPPPPSPHAPQTPTAAAPQARQPLPSRRAPMVSSPLRARPPTLHASLALPAPLSSPALPGSVPRAQRRLASTAPPAPTLQQEPCALQVTFAAWLPGGRWRVPRNPQRALLAPSRHRARSQQQDASRALPLQASSVRLAPLLVSHATHLVLQAPTPRALPEASVPCAPATPSPPPLVQPLLRRVKRARLRSPRALTARRALSRSSSRPTLAAAPSRRTTLATSSFL